MLKWFPNTLKLVITPGLFFDLGLFWARIPELRHVNLMLISVVQLIGARKQAQQFAYRLELNGHRRRLTWEATPRSIHEGVARYIILRSDCRAKIFI